MYFLQIVIKNRLYLSSLWYISKNYLTRNAPYILRIQKIQKNTELETRKNFKQFFFSGLIANIFSEVNFPQKWLLLTK